MCSSRAAEKRGRRGGGRVTDGDLRRQQEDWSGFLIFNYCEPPGWAGGANCRELDGVVIGGHGLDDVDNSGI